MATLFRPAAALSTQAARMKLCGVTLALISGLSMLACGSSTGKPASRSAKTRVEDSSSGSVDLSTDPYHAEAVANGGSVEGVITLIGEHPPAMPITTDSAMCARGDDGEPRNGASLGNAVVWIAGVHQGKSLPMDRRSELDSQDCQLDPRVQGAVTGTTINVFNDDKVLHRLVFVPLGSHDTLTVMPFANSGEVVPSEVLSKEAHIVEVTCARHPWTRAYIAVFDNPYYAVTDDAGAFKIDSLPPGKYTMMVWHEGMKQPMSRQVQVAPGGAAKINLAVTLTAPTIASR